MTDEKPKLAGVLAADIGNTRVALGCVVGEQVFATRRMAVEDTAGLVEVLREYWASLERPRRIVACSVNPAGAAAFEKLVADTLNEKVVLIGRDIPLPLDTALREPEKVGVDRLCCAMAAFTRLQGACVVADFGTAITVDFVSAEGVFQGGAILPGLRMQANALHTGTAQLPAVELRSPDWVFGRNTDEAIVGGIVFGARGALRALVESYATEIALWPTVICTGGDAELVVRDLLEEGFVQAIVPNLSLVGVALTFYKSLLPPEAAASNNQ